MPWYRLYADHGPGHQGQSEKYEFYGDGWDEESLRELWQDWCHKDFLDDAIGDVELVKELPEKERQEQIEKYRNRIESDFKMLQILGAEEE